MKKFKITLIAINILLAGGLLVLSFARSADGPRIAGLEKDLTTLRLTNRQTQEDIRRLSSLEALRQAAQDSSFVPLRTRILEPAPVAQAAH